MTKNQANSNKHLYTVIVIFILFISSITLILYYGNRVDSGVRGFVYGEGQYAKAQKQAVVAILNLIISEDESYYDEFKNDLLVNIGDRIAREALLSDPPDFDLARQGLLQGKNRPEDVDQMIWVFQTFKNMDSINRAIDIWTLADEKIEELMRLGTEIYLHIENNELTDGDISTYTQQIIKLNDELTVLQTDFSIAMSNAAQQAGNIVFWFTVLVSFLLTLIVAILSTYLMRSQKKSNESIAASEKKFRSVLNNSRDIIYQLNLKTGRFDYVSSSVSNVLGFDASKVMERGPQFIFNHIHPDDRKWMKEECSRWKEPDLKKITIKDADHRVRKADGTYIWVNNQQAPIKNEEGEVVAVVGNVRDITARVRQMAEINKSLEEKKVLLAEIHHRVKNNLGVISSLIEIQKADKDESDIGELEELQGRIKSIALVHEKLYKSGVLSEINLAKYLKELTEIIATGYEINQRKIDIRYDLQNLMVDITVAMPVGLICNELINNTFKHVFTDNRKDWSLKLDLHHEKDTVELGVSDNGGCLPQDFRIEDQMSMGMTLVNALVAQLGGEVSVEVDKNKQTFFRIRFNL